MMKIKSWNYDRGWNEGCLGNHFLRRSVVGQLVIGNRSRSSVFLLLAPFFSTFISPTQKPIFFLVFKDQQVFNFCKQEKNDKERSEKIKTWLLMKWEMKRGTKIVIWKDWAELNELMSVKERN